MMRTVAPGAARADVVVLGGGLAGLAAALAFGRNGRRVVLIERDGRTDDGSADELFERWDRPGIAHFRQPHNFLGLGRRVLLENAPDILETVLSLGALENRQYDLLPGEPRPEDEMFVSICARRPVFEGALRRAVDADANVEVVADTRVVGLEAVDGRADGPVRVIGARTDDGAVFGADLVVDALGRTSRVLSWLAELGARPPQERRSECGLLYYSRHFRFRPGVEMPAIPSLLRGPRGEIGYLAYSVFVEDNRELRSLKSEQAYIAAVPGLRAHLSGCPACREEHESLRALVGGDQAR
jgi:2-polyprenyl-6-methoxyphenol hydroxylase-like FAD-dependent oxidoreductase